MLANQPYDPMSIMRFSLSLLSLGAELDVPAPIGAKEASTGALFEAEQLKDQMERRSSGTEGSGQRSALNHRRRPRVGLR
jgi:hypothetical protein